MSLERLSVFFHQRRFVALMSEGRCIAHDGRLNFLTNGEAINEATFKKRIVFSSLLSVCWFVGHCLAEALEGPIGHQQQ
jgi:hypothetical protein